jgi:hypothetical protein
MLALAWHTKQASSKTKTVKEKEAKIDEIKYPVTLIAGGIVTVHFLLASCMYLYLQVVVFQYLRILLLGRYLSLAC